MRVDVFHRTGGSPLIRANCAAKVQTVVTTTVPFLPPEGKTCDLYVIRSHLHHDKGAFGHGRPNCEPNDVRTSGARSLRLSVLACPPLVCNFAPIRAASAAASEQGDPWRHRPANKSSNGAVLRCCATWPPDGRDQEPAAEATRAHLEMFELCPSRV